MKKLAILLLTAAPIVSAQDWMATSFEHDEVSPGIFVLMGADGKMSGGNIGLLVGDEYVVLIDDGFTPLGPALQETIIELAGRPADFLINTHAHGDHTGSNQFLSEQGTIIVAHDKLRSRMEGDPRQNTGPGALPVVTFSDSLTFHVNGQEAFVFHISDAHTDGDAAILFRDANVIATGDVVFRGMFPFIDLDSGGSVAGFKAAIQKLIDMADEDTQFISGHGPVGTRAGLRADLAMLIDAESRVKALLVKGMTDEQVVAEDPLSVYHDDYSWSFITTERMTRTLIRSLTAEDQ